MTQAEKSAIIGFYRSGVTFTDIAKIICGYPDVIEVVIVEYLKEKDLANEESQLLENLMSA